MKPAFSLCSFSRLSVLLNQASSLLNRKPRKFVNSNRSHVACAGEFYMFVTRKNNFAETRSISNMGVENYLSSRFVWN